MRSHNHLDKAAITKAAKKKNSISIDTGYFAFLKHNSTNERFTDKDRHQKIKITSTDKFDDCVLKVSEQLQETISADSGRPGLPLFCGAVDGVDDVLSAYANMALSSEQSTGSADVCAIFFDINPYKIDYFTFRLFLTQISETREEYLRNLFFYMKGEAGLKPEQILEKAARSTVTKEIHADYLIQQTKQKIIRYSANFQTALRDNLRTNILTGLELLNVVRNGRTHYKNLAKSLKKNMELNPKTHWLTDETLYL
ncbi:hypothetical protein KY362_03355, partial [Candidatus Woesearchaeota archaeon]|nr:hypothetical protein [Candidatus Woesearchaeota archaeon]